MLEKSYLCGINNNLREKSRTRMWVVICLKSLTFVVSITTTNEPIKFDCRCDLLEKSYLCGINNNRGGIGRNDICVVICLKSLTFVVSITTQALCTDCIRCCDLLEKSYLCGINNNQLVRNGIMPAVVICLKSLTFVVSITTD